MTISDMERLARDLCQEQGGVWDFIREPRRDNYRRMAQSVIRSTWLHDHDAALLVEARAEAEQAAVVYEETRIAAASARVDGPLRRVHRALGDLSHAILYDSAEQARQGVHG